VFFGPLPFPLMGKEEISEVPGTKGLEVSFNTYKYRQQCKITAFSFGAKR
jgi:hypothetical protein